ncbi:related to Serine/threonine-protein kinase ATG1 [Saccharomycodes ludwigii]|uniref:Serine/threonine-protein kinase ATG1 n=1 Tax=Saccharomycodes ludwigii TaxID=36035 RepID=A0A376B993_9ASCO|nr:hypothetical protein SCDLUD_001401 [Saccharomycodes ludwigii]KAH3901635.1 hypothetical protein SCDLUD_001401 [Saccharomycodes ludwigii]SSD61139.1 related to Serine/threonine-protein kinase ATG1 [Saccharomycodes ludwigii]
MSPSSSIPTTPSLNNSNPTSTSASPKSNIHRVNTNTSNSMTLVRDKYTIDNEIGRGSFATVYKGYINHPDSKKRKTVAIKAVSKSALQNKKLLDNLEVEIAILKKIKNPHIVSLIDCQRTSTDFYLIMEFCSLGDLSFLIKRKSDLIQQHPLMKTILEKYPSGNKNNTSSKNGDGLNKVLVYNYIKQLATALKFLRSKNLVHRDIKPQNLLLSAPFIGYNTPEEFHNKLKYVGIYHLPILKVADFGFARFLPNTSMAETLCGSPLYMAPEILSYQKYNAKADLWSVGAVLYEMCCGKPPFRANNHMELLKKIKQANDVITFPKIEREEKEEGPTGNKGDEPLTYAMKELICGLLTRDPLERMGFSEFFSNSIVNMDLSIYEEEEQRQKRQDKSKVEEQSQKMVESNLFISDYLNNDNTIANKQNNTNLSIPADSPNLNDKVEKKNNDKDKQHKRETINDNQLNDSDIEKEYVVIEKKSVEFNVLADELATFKKNNKLNIQHDNSTNTRLSSSPNNNNVATNIRMRRSSSSSSRRSSFDRRKLSISSLNPSNALSKALEMASSRLWGNNTTNNINNNGNNTLKQTTGLGTSPYSVSPSSLLAKSPSIYNNTPTNNKDLSILNKHMFKELTENIILDKITVNDTINSVSTNKELVTTERKGNTDILNTLEILAAKAYTIYSFAEVKTSQLKSDSFSSAPDCHSGTQSNQTNSNTKVDPIKGTSLDLFDNLGVVISDANDHNNNVGNTDIIGTVMRNSDIANASTNRNYDSCAIEDSSDEETDNVYNYEYNNNNNNNNNNNRNAIITNATPITTDLHINSLSIRERYSVSMEALMLYLKTLSILAKSLKITSNWWNKHSNGALENQHEQGHQKGHDGHNGNRNVTSGDHIIRTESSVTVTSNNIDVNNNNNNNDTILHLNLMVQWLRAKFNDCLEKAETLKMDIQRMNGLATKNIKLDDIHVIVEKLIYDRALQISKIAATAELQGKFWSNCELSYATSLWMLETLLDEYEDFDTALNTDGANNGDDGGTSNNNDSKIGIKLDDHDRGMVEKYIVSISKRLKALKRKIDM